MDNQLLFYLFDELVMNQNTVLLEALQNLSTPSPMILSFLSKLREEHFRVDPEDVWLDLYTDIVFFQLFRMKKETFRDLLTEIIENDSYSIIKKRYRGGHYPIQPERGLLVFLWYMSKPDSLHSIGDRFNIVPSSVMQIVNAFLYIINFKLRYKYITWPKSEEEFNNIKQQFRHYPGVVGAIDRTKINIKVPKTQHDSYVDRYHNHSITVIAVCTAHNIVTYLFTGFPGSAHDSRVFSYSLMARHIEEHGPAKYFPNRDDHLLGDSAFPLKEWMMTPYRDNPNITRDQRRHNYLLSADRVAIEHTFGLVKGRWRRLFFINTYSVSKAVEIANAAFILHNLCYMHGDEWPDPYEEENEEAAFVQNRADRFLGEDKRNRICAILNQ
ncbi:hypothetical protein RN001_002654 [Aquatica leii]|uniref:DDE Tnp4 domain-containing protein n=1 Tax=Aquatica leii TaxID=1421715 RepID=A0AAN7QNM7_9COLE|nr:hypothetical protein RN001_002654 [Aquatica leii]